MADRRAVARAHIATTVLGVGAFALGVLLLLWLFGFGSSRYIAAALALTPYVAGCGVVLACSCLILRRRRVAGAAVLFTLALAATLLPRLVPNDQPQARGPTLGVMAVNVAGGQAKAADVLERVRGRDVDVLCLLELTPTAVFQLQEAGLFELLPSQVLRPTDDGGAGVAAKFTVLHRPVSSPAGFGALVRLPNGRELSVVAVHAVTPLKSVRQWRSALMNLPPARVGEQTPPRVLAGTFNATLDHAPLRELLDSGYVDAAAQLGEGLVPTWPDGVIPPPITIDHILAGAGFAVQHYETFDIRGTAHDAVYAELTLPT